MYPNAPKCLLAGLRKVGQPGQTWRWVCFIDTAPTISDQSSDVLRLADLVLIPVRPLPLICGQSRKPSRCQGSRQAFLFVITQAKGNATITAQTIAALSEHGRVAQAFIADRVPYAVALAGGQAAQELSPKGLAAKEIAALWQNVKSCFHEKMKKEKQARRKSNG